MGIAVKELLTLEYFREFYVLAGEKGLGREIQGITVLEAPDCFHWTRGKEMILSSGYVISKDPDCILRAFQEGSLQRCSALMLKRGRYLDPVPEPIRALFDHYEIPLISIPFAAPWMEVMNQVNTAVMNRTIRRFRISCPDQEDSLVSQSYQERKIRRILQAVEAEMKFPAFLYDISEEQGYYSSVNFRTLAKGFGLRDEDFWDPQVACTRHTLCDYIEMVRFRMTEEDKHGRRVSWIRIPITAGGHTKAWFVLMEAREFLDYYDEYAIRIAYLVLQNIYEQVHAVTNIGNVGFENFVLYALSTAEEDPRKLRLQASLQGLSMETRYFYAVFRRKHTEGDHKAVRKAVLDTFLKQGLSKVGRLALTAENEGFFFWNRESVGSWMFWKQNGFFLPSSRNFFDRIRDLILNAAFSGRKPLFRSLRPACRNAAGPFGWAGSWSRTGMFGYMRTWGRWPGWISRRKSFPICWQDTESFFQTKRAGSF